MIIIKKVIIGAGKNFYDGWISTQEEELNLLDINNYYKLFKCKGSVDAFLVEHVFESAGFKVDLLEYCDDNGIFHFNY